MGEFKEIDAREAKELIDNGNLNIIDIRDEVSYENGHIEGADHVSGPDIEGFVNTADKEKPLLCYCFHGFSSQQAASYFVENGFKDVYSMTGGYEDWKTVFAQDTGNG